MFSTSGDIIMNVGDTMCTLGDVQYIREIPWVNREEYHEYIGGCSVHHDIPQCTHDIPQCTHDIPWCTEHHPMYSSYPPTCIMISPNAFMLSPLPDALMVLPDVLNIPYVLMISPNVLNTPWCNEHPRCTEYPPMYWTHIIQGDFIFVSSPQMEIF